jgi:hypothetical protein
MDLLGSCNSDSDSDDNNAAEFPVGAIRGTQDTKLPPPTSSTTTTTTTKAKSSKADKKKRVVGKKLLKLPAVLPEHILNQLQLSGGGGAKDKYNENNDDDTSDDSSDDDDNDNDDNDDKKASSRRKTTTTTSTAAAASSRDYSRDEGLIGLLSALSKSNSSSSSRKQVVGTKILGSIEILSSFTEQVVHNNDSPTMPSSMPSTEKPKSEPLGAAFLTSTVETTKRKRKEPMTVRSIHDRKEDTSSSEMSGYTPVPSSATSVHTTTSNQASSTVPRPSRSTIAPQLRVKATSSLRSAAPRVGIASTTAYSSHNHSTTYTPVMSQHSTSTGHNQQGDSKSSSYEQQVYHQKHQEGYPKKKKPLSRKRQMEQMLRAGKLDQVQGDHELQGVAHVYQQEGDHVASAMSSSSNNNTGAGVRVVPTGTYDASLGATAMSTDVSSRQKNSNQLNSLLANAASLESHRAQNPQFHGVMGGKGKSGNHRANAKQKYGW